jgi:hypothetical protein
MADITTVLGDEELLSNIGSSAANIGQGAYQVVIIVLSIVILGTLLFYVWWLNSFKFKVKIKEVLSSDGHFIIIEDKAKRRQLGGAEFWKLRRRRAIITAPPREALQVTIDGKYYAECIHHEKSGLDAGYEWIVSNKDLVKGDYEISSSQEERAILADRVVRAIERKGRSLLDIVLQFAGMAFVLTIVIALLAFYGEIAGSVNDATIEVGKVAQYQQEMLKQQVEFQRQLNLLFKELDCSVPSTGIDNVNLPLDQTVNTGG